MMLRAGEIHQGSVGDEIGLTSTLRWICTAFCLAQTSILVKGKQQCRVYRGEGCKKKKSCGRFLKVKRQSKELVAHTITLCKK